MKRYISHLVFALLGCMALSACVDNDYMELDKGHNELALSTSNTEVVLNEQAHGDDALELSWTTGTNYGTGNKISYTLELAKAGSNFTAPYVALESVEPMTKALEETGMLSLFWEMEMPLLFTLHDMEEEGIQVEGGELKEYGSRMEVRIKELETIIYEKAGEAFNINSPKQLGVILFEKLQLPGGKKTRPGIPQRRMCWTSWRRNTPLWRISWNTASSPS